jgi:hypothetical protein
VRGHIGSVVRHQAAGNLTTTWFRQWRTGGNTWRGREEPPQNCGSHRISPSTYISNCTCDKWSLTAWVSDIIVLLETKATLLTVVPVPKHHAMEAYRGRGDKAPRIYNFGGEWLTSRSCSLPPTSFTVWFCRGLIWNFTSSVWDKWRPLPNRIAMHASGTEFTRCYLSLGLQVTAWRRTLSHLSSPRFRQMLSDYPLIMKFLVPKFPHVISVLIRYSFCPGDSNQAGPVNDPLHTRWRHL